MSVQENLDTKSFAFIGQLEKLISSLQKSEPLSFLQNQSWDSFIKLGLPDKKNELFRQVRLRDLYSRSYSLPIEKPSFDEDFSAFIYPECQQSTIVFINGKFSEEHSSTSALPSGISVIPLSKAYLTYSAFLKNREQKRAQEEKNPFILLNGALLQEGVFIYVQPKVQLDFPIQIVHLVSPSEEKNPLLQPRIHIFASRESHLKCIFRQQVLRLDSERFPWINFLLDADLEENAHVEWNHVNFCEFENCWNFESFRANLKKDSSFKSVNISNGNRTHRQDYKIALQGANSQASLEGLWKIGQGRQSHVNVLMQHQAPHCQSLQNFKGILSDFSRSSFEGKIYVHREAQKTQAYQRNHHLILSDEAEAYSKPNLEIFADDVKASHGATVGQLSEEELFYLKSRGIPEEAAKNILIYGFGKEVIDRIFCPKAKEEINAFFYAGA